jgi:amidase
MSSVEPHRLSATEVVALTRSGKLSVEDYAKSLLSQIEKRDSAVHAWVFLDPDLVLAQARELDLVPADKRGPLHGCAIGVKVKAVTKLGKCS